MSAPAAIQTESSASDGKPAFDAVPPVETLATLTVLRLRCPAPDDLLQTLATHAPQLEELYLKGGAANLQPPQTDLPHLRRLRLSWPTRPRSTDGIHPKRLPALLDRLPALVSLRTQRIGGLASALKKHSRSPQLRQLRLDHSRSCHEVLRYTLGGCTTLQSFRGRMNCLDVRCAQMIVKHGAALQRVTYDVYGADYAAASQAGLALLREARPDLLVTLRPEPSVSQ